jgi:hypothetical protein
MHMYIYTRLFVQAGKMVAAMEGDTTQLTEIVIRAVKEDRMDEIREMREMQWQAVRYLAIMQRSLAEFCNDQPNRPNRRGVAFVPSSATIFWYNPRIILRVGTFLGIPAIDLSLLEEVRQLWPLFLCAHIHSFRSCLSVFECVPTE